MDDIDDAALFESVVSGAATEEQSSEPATESAQEAQPRDESGKFAPKAQEPDAQPAAEASSPEREPAIPPHRLREEAEARRAEKERADRLEQMLSQVLQSQRAPPQHPAQQPQEPPDIFTDPEAWFKYKRDQEIAPIIQQIQAARLEDARAVASVVYGDDTVKAAEQAFNELAKRGGVDPAEYQRIQSSPNPYRAAVEWHKRNSILSEIGNDPNAYRERIKAEILAELGGAQAQQQPPANVVKIPPSLNRATSAAPANQGGGQVLSDADLFKQVTSRRR